MDWSTDLEQLNSWAERLQPFHDFRVGSIVPTGFEAVGRLFHPLYVTETEIETWADVAARNGKVAHAQM